MYPKRMTFEYLWRTIPILQTPQEFYALVAELERRGWFYPAPGQWNNFMGMLEAGLPADVKHLVVYNRNHARSTAHRNVA
jgi:hypothetical protein